MQYKAIQILVVFLFTSSIVLPQDYLSKKKQFPSLSAGIGVITFDGDIGGGVNVSSFGRIRTGYHFGIEQKIKNIIGLSCSATFGKIADSENGKIGGLNFQSTITQVDFNLIIPFDNNIFLKSGADFAPYIFGGVGYLIFDPHTDLYNSKGIKYNYWSDGTIRDLAQGAPGDTAANIISRDYIFETQLKDSSYNYSRSTLSFPLGIGFAFKLTSNVSLTLGGSYYLTFTDWIDNTKLSSNDRYLYANTSLKYTFGKNKSDESAPIYKSVDFSSVDKLDTDNDGIADAIDKCAGTPKGVKTDNKGCPLDGDDDGVPDYLDKHPGTKKGSLVDENGVPLNEQLLAEQQLMRDSIATERSQLFNENPSLKFLREIEAKNKQNPKKNTSIPPKFKPADVDGSGYISADEISNAIDVFFEGDSAFTVSIINDLIDYFFEQ